MFKFLWFLKAIKEICPSRLVKPYPFTEVREIHDLLRENRTMSFQIREMFVVALRGFKFADGCSA
jgi:hypothetical protein